MFQLDMTSEETKILIELLEHNISETRMEIADTDQMDFRDQLKKKKEIMMKILDILKQAQ